jgi:hypothetical protein
MKTWRFPLALLAAAGCLSELAQLTTVGDAGVDGGGQRYLPESGALLADAGLGDAGVSVISCTPMDLDFGVVAVGTVAVLPVTCTNIGNESIVLSSARFSSSPTQTSQAFTVMHDPTPVSLPPGDAVQIDVAYTPIETASDTGALVVNFDYSAGTSAEITLRGSGILGLPCYYSITPPTLNLGEICPSVPTIESFTITNLGPNECLVSFSVSLTPGSWGCSLPNGPLVSQRLSPPGTDGGYPSQLALSFEVCTQPDAGAFDCSIQLSISDPAARHTDLRAAGMCCGAMTDGGDGG